MDLSIIIVNWNSKEHLKMCIASILAETHGIKYEIVVVDNASFDGCNQMLRETYPQVRFIQSEKNLGFAKANNAAFHESHGRHLLFLNPDTVLVGPAINILLDFLKQSTNAGAMGCRLLNADKTLQTSCIQAFPTILNQLLDSELLRSLLPNSFLWGNSIIFSCLSGIGDAEVISGACLMVKRNVFEAVGRFSEDYFMYTEDVDLCYKIKNMGYKNYYVSNATIMHFGGGSTRKRSGYFSIIIMRESRCRFLIKTRGKLYGLCYRISTLIGALGRMAVLIIFLPLFLVQKERETWESSFRKWMAILVWSSGRSQILARRTGIH